MSGRSEKPDLGAETTMARIGFLVSTLSALVLALTGCSSDTGTNPALPPPPPPPGLSLAVEVAVTDLEDPIHLTAPPGDARLFVVEQPGRIRIMRGGVLLETPFLDITDRVRSGGERGLFSLAFHPSYSSNGLFYVSYTDVHGDSRVERYTVSADPDVADPSSARPILSVDQPFSNHNGGHVLFGPDGMLYVALGDGGGAGDPLGSREVAHVDIVVVAGLVGSHEAALIDVAAHYRLLGHRGLRILSDREGIQRDPGARVRRLEPDLGPALRSAAFADRVHRVSRDRPSSARAPPPARSATRRQPGAR